MQLLGQRYPFILPYNLVQNAFARKMVSQANFTPFCETLVKFLFVIVWISAKKNRCIHDTFCAIATVHISISISQLNTLPLMTKKCHITFQTHWHIFLRFQFLSDFFGFFYCTEFSTEVMLYWYDSTETRDEKCDAAQRSRTSFPSPLIAMVQKDIYQSCFTLSVCERWLLSEKTTSAHSRHEAQNCGSVLEETRRLKFFFFQ